VITKKPTALVILDGFGSVAEKKFNAIAQADTPNLNYWMAHYPHCLLQASGTWVGLPDGFIGNSEVGHETMGAGRILPQSLSIIQNAIHDKTLSNNALLLEKLAQLKKTGKTLHIIGLLSDAGIHSHTQLLYALIEIAVAQGIKKIVIHPILDGRDVPSQSAQDYLEKLDQFLKQIGIGTIGSLHGRFYAMDRDHNWLRTQASYNVLTQPLESSRQSWRQILEKNYAQNISDEFIAPTQLDPHLIIKPGDGIIFINYRPDRARQLTQPFIDPIFELFPVKKLDLAFFITPVSYGKHIKTEVLFEQSAVHNTLKEVLARNDKAIFSIAETEKYAHVTYFFAGGQEKIFPHEIRILIPSIVTDSYAKYPEMSSALITQSVLRSLKKSPKDFYLINYANADMVGHSGDLKATIKAIEFLDKQLHELYEKIVIGMQGTLYITADHGKAEEMYDVKNKTAKKSHTTNPVPFIMLRNDLKDSGLQLPLTQLADIAPFILKQMHIEVPEEMRKEK
jgi:2,3-bisphosphoglycerate-independent phosphoglycerate mutase